MGGGSNAKIQKFEQLYATYRQLLYYTANRVLRDPQLAEDAVQQAFMRIFSHMEKISEVECPQTKSFVVIIVRNVAINLYNSRKKNAVLSFEEMEGWTPASPNDELGEFADYTALVQTLNLLPEGYRDVLLLRYDNGYSVSEVAALLGISEENVKKRIQRARKKLETLLNGEEATASDVG